MPFGIFLAPVNIKIKPFRFKNIDISNIDETHYREYLSRGYDFRHLGYKGYHEGVAYERPRAIEKTKRSFKTSVGYYDEYLEDLIGYDGYEEIGYEDPEDDNTSEIVESIEKAETIEDFEEILKKFDDLLMEFGVGLTEYTELPITKSDVETVYFSKDDIDEIIEEAGLEEIGDSFDAFVEKVEEKVKEIVQKKASGITEDDLKFIALYFRLVKGRDPLYYELNPTFDPNETEHGEKAKKIYIEKLRNKVL